jgi:predicted nuclease of predicted toxin-antitoxin system
MKILLDECITRRLKTFFTPEHSVHTVVEMGWSGVKNGKLLALCIEHSFDVLLTIDKNLVFQQNTRSLGITVCVFDTPSSKIEELLKFLPDFERMSKEFQKGETVLFSI